MPENARQGQPVWIDYVCQNFDATKTFYSEVFDWDIVDQGPDFGHYHQIMKGSHPVGGFMRAMNFDGTPNLATPAMWTTYLNTRSIEETYSAAVASGAAEIARPMDVGPLGKMAIVTDPTGAGVGLWQAKDFTGFDLPMTSGTPVWFELMTVNYPVALDFYSQVFAFDLEAVPGDFGYSTHGKEDEAVAGICDASQWVAASYWRPYLKVDDADASSAKIVELGGAVLDGPLDSEFGRVVTVSDPEGATLQILQDL